MSRNKQREIHDLAKQMSEAISTAVEQRYIEDEAKLRAVLIENGWRKASEVAEEIFGKIFALCDNAEDKLDKLFNEINDYRKGYKNSVKHFRENMVKIKKEYTEGGE